MRTSMSVPRKVFVFRVEEAGKAYCLLSTDNSGFKVGESSKGLTSSGTAYTLVGVLHVAAAEGLDLENLITDDRNLQVFIGG
jgi:hypothetical protein